MDTTGQRLRKPSYYGDYTISMYQPKTSTSSLMLCSDAKRVVESLAVPLILDKRQNPHRDTIPCGDRYQRIVDVGYPSSTVTHNILLCTLSTLIVDKPDLIMAGWDRAAGGVDLVERRHVGRGALAWSPWRAVCNANTVLSEGE
jgi:hypothetical protein